MSSVLRHIGRYAAQKLASNPQARGTAAKVASAVVKEVQEIAREEDRARAAGQAFRRDMNNIQGYPQNAD